jgi:predicted  nucleic acid-binding Zn-ribbon protein
LLALTCRHGIDSFEIKKNNRRTMLPAIEKLLILQDRDRNITRLQEELAHIDPERQELQTKLVLGRQALDSAKHNVKHLESERKKLELEVDAKKQLIEKYSLQQFQTKKNEEYRALAHEIETCKEAITKLDDQQIEIMEQGEAVQKEVAAATRNFNENKKNTDSRLADLTTREASLTKELAELQSNRGELATAVDETTRSKYERLFKQKGRNVLVGIQHGVCGGCHMQLSRSVIVNCQAEQDLVHCPNCGRILYYTRDMNLAVAE